MVSKSDGDANFAIPLYEVPGGGADYRVLALVAAGPRGAVAPP